MHSAKQILTLDKATGLIYSLTSAQDMPFCQPQQLQCMHHGLSFVLQSFLRQHKAQ